MKHYSPTARRKTFEETSGYVSQEQVNKWPISTTDI
jgi:hypothetical protein